MERKKLNRKNHYLRLSEISAVTLIFAALTACGASNTDVASQGELKKPLNTVVAIEDLSTATHSKETMQKNTITKENQIILAKQDLAERLSISIEKIALLRADVVTWRSSALGCPKPNVRYMQALVPGSLIVLGANSKHYRYHGKINDVLSYCPNGRAESPSQSESDI